MAVKSFNESSGRLECLFMNDIEQNGFSQKTDLIGYAYLDEPEHETSSSSSSQHKPGEQLEALVAGFDAITRSFCLIVDKEKSRAYKKNFDASFRAKTACRVDQELKAEVLYVSEWFALVGLKQHAKGRLALMPLFKNEFTRLNSFQAVQYETTESATIRVERKIKQKQVVAVSAAQMTANESGPGTVKKSEKRFAYFSVGETIKVRVKDNTADAVDSDLVYLMVKHDETGAKENKKVVMRQLAVLNESRAAAEKRKAGEDDKNDNNDDNLVDVVKKKVLVNGAAMVKGAAVKRKASSGDVGDSLEVVASVKKPKLSELSTNKTATTTQTNGSSEKHDDGFAFPWEVNDFDQFNAIISRSSDVTTSVNGGDVQQTAGAKKKGKKNKDKIVDDRLIYEVTSI